MNLNYFQNETTLNQSLSIRIASNLTQAIKKRGVGYLAVSGGKTPKGLFQALSQIAINWEKVWVFLTDERIGEPYHEQSNERLVRDFLLKNRAKKANFISYLSCLEQTQLPHNSTNLEIGRAEDPDIQLKTLNHRLMNNPTFDEVILGMGEDGHTASLFPNATQLNEGLNGSDAIIFLSQIQVPFRRLTLTKNRLLNTRSLCLQIIGESKLKVLNSALKVNNSKKMPICAFTLQDNPPLNIYYAAQSG